MRLGALTPFVNLIFDTLVLQESSKVGGLEKFEILKRLINIDISFRYGLHQSRRRSLRFLWVGDDHWFVRWDTSRSTWDVTSAPSELVDP